MTKAQRVLVKLPLPRARWGMMVLPVIAGVLWPPPAHLAIAGIVWVLTLAWLVMGEKFEVDGQRRRYRVGLHWAHLLNPAWRPLPNVQGVVVKPYSYLSAGGNSRGWQPGSTQIKLFVVLLSVPATKQGVVVTTVDSRAQAEEIAVAVTEALHVPWQRA